MIISYDGLPIGELEMLIDTDKRVIMLQNGPLYVTLKQSVRSWIEFRPEDAKDYFYRYLTDVWVIEGVTYTGPDITRPSDIDHIMTVASSGQYTPRSLEEFAALAMEHGSRLEIPLDETGLQSKN